MVFDWIFAVLAIVACSLTLLSLIHSDQWWIQVLNFPRLLTLMAIALIALGCVIFARRWRIGLLLALLTAGALQNWRIYPYIFFAPVEVAEAQDIGIIPSDSCFSALSFNVLQTNRDYQATIRLIDREQPDVLLLMETDSKWIEALAPVLEAYPYRLTRPLDNKYGLAFASKLPVRSAHSTNITDKDTPTVYARLETRDGQAFNYIGLHPRPPVPGQDTDLRDRKIARAALQVEGYDVPTIAMGDFNDVAWSRTTQIFKQVGGYLDPRIGRGDFPSFPAKYAPVGWPLDQLFTSPEFTFRSFEILDNIGSDHRPLTADLCLAPDAALAANAAPERLDDDARSAARKMTGK